MLPYIIRRLLATIPVLVVVGLFTFFLLRFTPGDPAAVMAGNEATQEEYLEIKEKLGLDDPIHVQLGKWTGQILRGDFGTSIRSGKPVFDLIKTRIGPSVSLTIATEIIAVLVAIPLGVLAAWKANSFIDRADHGLRRHRLLRPHLLARIHPDMDIRTLGLRTRQPDSPRGRILPH